MGYLNSCIHELQQQAYAQRLKLQEVHHGIIESRREQFRQQEDLSMKEKLFRDTQIRNIHELGEVKKRAQELRIDEFSQLPSTQEQMNSMNDPKEFQEVKSNHGGRLSHVPSQPELIPSFSSMLSRDKRLKKTFLVNQDILLKEFIMVSHMKHKERQNQSVPRAIRTRTSFARDDEEHKSTILMPMFTRKTSTVSSSIPVEIQQTPMVGQQRQQISERQFDKFLTPHSCLLLEEKIQESSDYLILHRTQRFGSTSDRLLERSFQTLRCWTRRLLLL